jgi:hypothetical protein
MRDRSAWLWSLISLPLLLTFFHLFFHAKDRYHIPLDSIVAVFAAVAIAEAARIGVRWLASSRRQVAPASG